MKSRYIMGEFLEKYPEYIFHVSEYIELIKSAERVQTCLLHSNNRNCNIIEENPWVSRRKLIQDVVHCIPGYSCIDWSRFDYWSTIPLIDKKIVRQRYCEFVNPNFDRKRLWERPTSGTTGKPLTILYSPEFFARQQYFSQAEIVSRAGLLDEETVCRPIFSLSLADSRGLNNRVLANPTDLTGFTLRSVFREVDLSSAEEVISIIKIHQPAILSLKPNILARILELPSNKLDVISKSVRSIITGGARLDPALWSRATGSIGIPIIDYYGMTEIGLIGSYCKCDEGFMIHEESVVVEVLTEDGKLNSTGLGELVVSSVVNAAMPMLRYRTGDYGKLVYAVCRCGKPVKCIKNLDGRSVMNFRFRDGSVFSPTHLKNLLEIFPITELQITQLTTDDVEVGVEFENMFLDRQCCLNNIKNWVDKEIGLVVNIIVVEKNFDYGDEFQRYKTLLD